MPLIQTSIVLHANWRGVPEVAHYSGGQVVKNGYSLAQMPLAGRNVDAYLGTFRPEEVASWFGSLITNQKDASMLLYRRNRYYDPATGRFTQEDPIGLAGGLNLYGTGRPPSLDCGPLRSRLVIQVSRRSSWMVMAMPRGTLPRTSYWPSSVGRLSHERPHPYVKSLVHANRLHVVLQIYASVPRQP